MHLNGARQVEVIRSEYTFWLLLNMHLPKGVWSSQIPGPGGRLFEVGAGEGAQRQGWQESLLIGLSGSRELTVVLHQLKCHRLRVNSGS